MKLHFDSSKLSKEDAKLYFSNTLIQRDGKFYMTFPKFNQDNSGKNELPPIVELPINHKYFQNLKELNSQINPKDEENHRIVFAIEDDFDIVNGNLYSLYAVKIPKEKIKQSTKLEDLDDHSKFMEKVEFQLAYCNKIKPQSHSQTLSDLSASSVPPALSYLSTSFAPPTSRYPQTLSDLSASSVPPTLSYLSTSSAPPTLAYSSNPYHLTFCSFLDTLIPNFSCTTAHRENQKKGIANKDNIVRFSC